MVLKLQVQYQENYRLKLQLDAVTTEYQIWKSEYQADLDSLRKQLADEQKRAQTKEREQRKTIEELIVQNEQLSEQMLNVSS